jgi:hypothetical protein
MPVVQACMAKGVPIPMEAVQQLMASSPSLSDVQAFARKCLAEATNLSEADRAELEAGVAALSESQVSSETESKATLREGNVVIHDIAPFKASLRTTKAPTPVMPLKVEA